MWLQSRLQLSYCLPGLCPLQASLVISIPEAPHTASLAVQPKMWADMVAMLCQEALAAQPVYTNIKVSATRWMPKGNLVVFGGLDTSPDSLLAIAHVLTSAIFLWLPLLGPSHLSVHANVKWSKVLINGIPLCFSGPEALVAPLQGCMPLSQRTTPPMLP